MNPIRWLRERTRRTGRSFRKCPHCGAKMSLETYSTPSLVDGPRGVREICTSCGYRSEILRRCGP